MAFQLRLYQQEAIDAILSDWNEGALNVVLALPTGLGKTAVGIHLLRQTMGSGERALWLAHRDELIQQPLVRFQRQWPGAGVGIVKAERDDISARVVLGSVQTVCRPERMARLLAAGSFDYLVTDETHHAAAPTYVEIYKRLREANPGLRHVGLTATPQRSDGKSLRSVFDKISFQMNILKAVREGWLVPPHGIQIKTGVSISGVKVSHGDFVAGDLADVLDAARWHEKIADAYQEHAAGRQALAFTPTVLTSKRLVEEFRARGVNAAHVDGTTPRDVRREAVNLFRAQKIRVLSNCAVFLEGFDAPSASCVLFARPTQSHVLLTQVIGRGLRIYPGKKDCQVLMFATTGARILTLYDLGESKELREAKEAADNLAVVGVSQAIPFLFDEDKIEGVGLYARVVNLFAAETAAWYRDGAEFSLGLGEHEGYQRVLFIAPPNGDDEWHLWGLGRKVDYAGNAWSRNGKAKYGSWQARELATDPDVETLMVLAAGIIERRALPILSEKNKQWRKQPASPAQKKWVRRWVPGDMVEQLSKGECAQIITHGAARAVLGREGVL